MSIFTRDLEELFELTKVKSSLTDHLKKNYRENVHYIIERTNYTNVKKYGGQNKITYKLTEEVFQLFKNTYNLRNRYIVDINDNIKNINIGMCIENQTIGFIENAYGNMLNLKRQYIFGTYRADLYFIDYKLVIECDENDHVDRNPIQEKVRENYIRSLGNKIIRYNPNVKGFDLSNVLREINAVLFSGGHSN